MSGLLWLLLSAVLFICDQFAKVWALRDLAPVGSIPFSGKVKLPLEKACISLIIAGGAGNLYDRLTRGFVVDFIDINALFSYPMFNLADCFVVVGACLLMLGVFLEESGQKGKQPPVSAAPSVEGESPDPEKQPPEEK